MGKESKKGDKILSRDEKCVRGNWKKEACLGSKWAMAMARGEMVVKNSKSSRQSMKSTISFAMDSNGWGGVLMLG